MNTLTCRDIGRCHDAYLVPAWFWGVTGMALLIVVVWTLVAVWLESAGQDSSASHS